MTSAYSSIFSQYEPQIIWWTFLIDEKSWKKIMKTLFIKLYFLIFFRFYQSFKNNRSLNENCNFPWDFVSSKFQEIEMEFHEKSMCWRTCYIIENKSAYNICIQNIFQLLLQITIGRRIQSCSSFLLSLNDSTFEFGFISLVVYPVVYIS